MSVFKTLASAFVALSLIASGFANAGVDPVQPDPNTGANFNRYAYANNNPYKFKDPDGREAACVTLGTNCFNSGGTFREKATTLGAFGGMLIGGFMGGSITMAATQQVTQHGVVGATLANAEKIVGAGVVTAEAVAGTQIASRVPSPEAMIGSLAQSHANSGVPALMSFLRGGEKAAVVSGSRATPAMLGQAVHRATAQSLNQMAPGRFQYNSRAPWDFTDRATGQALELTTPGQAASHANRGADLVFYTLPPYP